MRHVKWTQGHIENREELKRRDRLSFAAAPARDAARKATPLPGHHSPTDIPIFDRGVFEPVNPEVRIGFADRTRHGEDWRSHHLTRRLAATRTVTGAMLGDPKPGRAGRAPDCEDSRKRERSDEAYRLLGREPPENGYGSLDLDQVKTRLERLKPRRWTPPHLRDAAE